MTLAIAALALAGCGTTSGEGDRTHSDFMSACTKRGGSDGFCECSYGWFAARYGKDGAMEGAARVDEVGVARVMMECARK